MSHSSSNPRDNGASMSDGQPEDTVNGSRPLSKHSGRVLGRAGGKRRRRDESSLSPTDTESAQPLQKKQKTDSLASHLPEIIDKPESALYASEDIFKSHLLQSIEHQNSMCLHFLFALVRLHRISSDCIISTIFVYLLFRSYVGTCPDHFNLTATATILGAFFSRLGITHERHGRTGLLVAEYVFPHNLQKYS